MKKKKQNTPIKNYLIILLLFIIGFLLFFNRNNYSKMFQSDINKTQKSPICEKYGTGDLVSYLPIYKVKSGDSLLSIANNELQNTDRVTEIIELNKDKYPELSLKNSFVEIGWELILPPKNTKKTNGKIVVRHGNLSISDSGWGVTSPNSGVGPFNLSSLNNNDQQTTFSQNDCVSVLYQAKDNYGEELKVFEILAQ